MQKPKKYTAKEAMHWMLDHPDYTMIEIDIRQEYRWVYKFDYKRFYFCIADRFKGSDPEWNQTLFPHSHVFYIEGEWNDYQFRREQESLKKKQEEERYAVGVAGYQVAAGAIKKQESTEPKEGEEFLEDYVSLRTAICRDDYEALKLSRIWIESYVQREIRKALGGL